MTHTTSLLAIISAVLRIHSPYMNQLHPQKYIFPTVFSLHIKLCLLDHWHIMSNM